MAKDFQFSIIARFKDLAAKGVERLRKGLVGLGKTSRGVGGGGLGGALLGGVALATKAFGSLVRVAGRVAGAVVGIFASMVRTVLGAFRALAGAAGRVLGTIPKLLVGATVAVGGLAAAFGLLLSSVARAGDEIAKMARRTGLSVKFLSEMRHVLELNDASLGDLQTAIRGLGRAVEGTVRGSEEYLEIWEALGVSIYDQNGRLKDSEQLFMDVVAALRRVDNATLRLGMAQRVFGRSGERMLAFIDSLTTSLEEQREAAHQLGATWSPEMARMAERAVDAWSKMKTAWRGLKKEFLGPFLEPVAKQLEHLANWLASNRAAVSRWGAEASAWFAAVADVIRQRLGAALEWLTTREWSFENLKAGLGEITDTAVDQAGKVWELLKNYIEQLKAHALGVVDAVASYLNERIGGQLQAMMMSLTEASAEAFEKSVAKGERSVADILKKGIGGGEEWIGRLGLKGLGLQQPEGAVEFRKGQALGVAADALERVVTSLRTAGKEAPGRQAEREAELEVLAQEAAQLQQTIAAGVEQGVTAALAKGAPAKPPGPEAAAPAQGPLPPGIPQGELFQLQRQASRYTETANVAEMLREAGAKDEAQKVQEKADVFKERLLDHLKELGVVLDSVAELQGLIIDKLKEFDATLGAVKGETGRLKQRVKNLGQSRA